MNKNQANEFWRATTFALLAVALMGLVSTMGFLLITIRTLQTSSRHFHQGLFLTDPFRKFLVTMAVIVGLLLVFSVFCTAVLVIRYFTHRMRSLQLKHPPTPYVDAWKIAGERLEVPADDPPGDTATEGETES